MLVCVCELICTWHRQSHGLGRLTHNLLAERVLAQITLSQLDDQNEALQRVALLDLLTESEHALIPVLQQCCARCCSTQEVATAVYERFGFGYDHK